jgi:hypothetical protein
MVTSNPNSEGTGAFIDSPPLPSGLGYGEYNIAAPKSGTASEQIPRIFHGVGSKVRRRRTGVQITSPHLQTWLPKRNPRVTNPPPRRIPATSINRSAILCRWFSLSFIGVLESMVRKPIGERDTQRARRRTRWLRRACRPGPCPWAHRKRCIDSVGRISVKSRWLFVTWRSGCCRLPEPLQMSRTLAEGPR